MKEDPTYPYFSCKVHKYHSRSCFFKKEMPDPGNTPVTSDQQGYRDPGEIRERQSMSGTRYMVPERAGVARVR